MMLPTVKVTLVLITGGGAGEEVYSVLQDVTGGAR